MDFLLNDEQRQIVEMVRELAKEKVAPYAAQWDAEERFPHELVEVFAVAGLLGLAVPEEYGGLGAHPLTRVAVIEELAKVDASAALLVAVQDLGMTPIQIGNWPRRRWPPTRRSGTRRSASRTSWWKCLPWRGFWAWPCPRNTGAWARTR